MCGGLHGRRLPVLPTATFALENGWKKPEEFLRASKPEAKRVEMFNLSSSEAPQFVKVITQMTEKNKGDGSQPR